MRNKKKKFYSYGCEIGLTYHELTNAYVCSIMVYRHPIRVVEQGNYHVIVYYVYSGVQHPMVWCIGTQSG